MLPVGSQVEGWHAVPNGLVMLRSPACKHAPRPLSAFRTANGFGEGPHLRAEVLVRGGGTAPHPVAVACPCPLFQTLRDTSLAFKSSSWCST